MMKRFKCIFTLWIIFSIYSGVWAFNGHVGTAGPVTVTIGEVKGVSRYDTPYPVMVSVKNTGGETLSVTMEVRDLVDEFKCVGENRKTISVSGGKTESVQFQIASSPGAFAALYPVHVYASFESGGKKQTIHCVQIFETVFEPKRSIADIADVVTIPADGAVLLTDIRSQQILWQYFDKPMVSQPIGWRGSVESSGANFEIYDITRDTTKKSLAMHPTWRNGAGTIFAQYKIKLPDTKPITFSFSNAIRDITPPEPPSDGVTFRVWVGDKTVYEKHTDSKIWIDGAADLSEFAGQEILLRMECHPGPKKDTTCDSAFWGDPVIASGGQTGVETREMQSPKAFLFALADGYKATVVGGPHGIFDGAISFGRNGRILTSKGLAVSILNQKVGVRPSGIIINNIRYDYNSTAGCLRMIHSMVANGRPFELVADVFVEGPGLRIKVECPERITDLTTGAFDQTAEKVYYGHGYCIVKPQAFRAGFGGHNLATSHVGFEFDNGMSLLVATDNPPDYFEVLPERKIYSLHTHMNATLTLLPSDKGAFDCAIRYRPLYDKKPSPGVARKAGRFVFDVWGGRYSDIADTMKRLIDYGLTDSLLTLHVWQRWGYDYRLPDINPPDPSMGTVEDMLKIDAVCRAMDIPWGLHDNYIDFYPDATDYSYEHIAFTEDGRPVKAWLNEGRGAQSYRWRPDHIMPFVKRNLEWIKPNLRPTHYFIDVFTSINMFDFYDRTGKFHSMLETRKYWGESFRWIQDYLGPGTITTSEAGDDQLVGWLDGADCQHMQLSATGGSFHNRVVCTDWERVPWFDAVLHDKFIQHGVGYPGRYEGGRSTRDHGIESDDYISDELLLGHAMMIDRNGFVGNGAIRKYWLAQDFIRNIAMAKLTGVEYVGGDIHRQIVTWDNGAKVYVNRGESDWTVADKILPMYGYYAVNGENESSIERIGGAIVEQSKSGKGMYYFNGRGFTSDNALAIRPSVKAIEVVGPRKFKMPIHWQATEAAPKDLAIFVHFKSDKAQRRDKIAFQGDHSPKIGTGSWKGEVVTLDDRTLDVPPDAAAGAYSVEVGLWDPAGSRRYSLVGADDNEMSYRVGTLYVDTSGGLRFEPVAERPMTAGRWGGGRGATDFGLVTTAGAVRCEVQDQQVVITPLPDRNPFTVQIDPAKLIGPNRSIGTITVVDREGKTIGEVKATTQGAKVTFEVDDKGFAYIIQIHGR